MLSTGLFRSSKSITNCWRKTGSSNRHWLFDCRIGLTYASTVGTLAYHSGGGIRHLMSRDFRGPAHVSRTSYPPSDRSIVTLCPGRRLSSSMPLPGLLPCSRKSGGGNHPALIGAVTSISIFIFYPPDLRQT